MSETTCQLLVIGAGPAGMAAAQTAARHGVEVIVVDDQPRPGGQIYRNVDASPLARPELLGREYLYGRQQVLGFRQAPLEYLADSSVWYLDRHGEAGIVSAGVHRRIRAAGLRGRDRRPEARNPLRDSRSVRFRR